MVDRVRARWACLVVCGTLDENGTVGVPRLNFRPKLLLVLPIACPGKFFNAKVREILKSFQRQTLGKLDFGIDFEKNLLIESILENVGEQYKN